MTLLADSPHSDVDLAVIGAGLAGTGLAASLRQAGFDGTILLLEAGRGPGGRAASRRRRDDLLWRLDHGAPCFSFSQPPPTARGRSAYATATATKQRNSPVELYAVDRRRSQT